MADDESTPTNPHALPPEVAAVLEAVRKDAVVNTLKDLVTVVGGLQKTIADQNDDLVEDLSPLIRLSSVCLAVLDREVGVPKLGATVKIGTLGGLILMLLALLVVMALFGVDAVTLNQAALGWCEGLGLCDHVEFQCETPARVEE